MLLRANSLCRSTISLMSLAPMMAFAAETLPSIELRVNSIISWPIVSKPLAQIVPDFTMAS